MHRACTTQPSEAYQPPANNTFLSEQTSRQQSASSTFLQEQISTSHQPNEQVVSSVRRAGGGGGGGGGVWGRPPPPVRRGASSATCGWVVFLLPDRGVPELTVLEVEAEREWHRGQPGNRRLLSRLLRWFLVPPLYPLLSFSTP
jgi:hypothetical protein